MDTASIVVAFEAERDRLNRAIIALQGRKRGPGRAVQFSHGGRRHLSAAARSRSAMGDEEKMGCEEEECVILILFTTYAAEYAG